MSISTRLKGLLDDNQILYSVMTHATAYTAQGAAATLQISGKELAKSVVLWTGEEMVLAVLPALNQASASRVYAGFVGAKTSITPLISRTWNFGNGGGAIGS